MNLANKKIILIFCILSSVIFIYPLFSDKLVIGHDTLFHLSRIEALKIAYLNLDFFPKIYHYQNFMFGYGTPLFYSDIFLILPAIIRVVGVPLVLTYKIYLFSCTFLSVLTMFWASNRILKNVKGAYLSSFLYLFCTYRITDVYVRGALGEVMAMIFIPIVIYGIYNCIYEESPKYTYLVIGFSGLLLVHNITFVLFCIVFGVILIANIKKLSKEYYRIVVIAKAIVISMGILTFFLIPMFEQLFSGNYAINEFIMDSNISNHTLFIEQLFTTSVNFGLSGHEFGRSYWMTTNIGPIILVLSIFYIFFKQGKIREIENNKFISLLLWIGLSSVVLCLNFVPWEILNDFFSFIQFPWRLMIVAMGILPIVAAKNIDFIYKSYTNLIVNTCLILTLSVGVYQLTFINKQESKISNDTPYGLISEDAYSGKHGIVTYFNQAELAAADYLPIKSNINYREYGDYIKTNNPIQIENFQRTYNLMEFTINMSKEDSFYILPLIYYKGYSVEVYNSNSQFIRELPVYPDEEAYLVSFKPGEVNEPMTYKIQYKGTKVQYMSYGVTIIICMYLLFNGYIKGRGKR